MTFDTRAALDAILPRLDRGDAPASKWPDADGEYWALCPFHRDRTVGNFSVSERGFTCFSCGAAGGLAKLAEHLHVDLKLCSCAVVLGGMTHTFFSLAEYAEAKALPVDFLKTTFSVTESKRGARVSLRMPYLDQEGKEACVRYRIAMDGDKFRWSKGSKLNLYGLWLLDQAAVDVILVEGESDTQTLTFHGIPALGVPGAKNWRRDWAEHVAGKVAYAWQEPDAAGAAFVARIGKDLPDLRIITAPEGYKDVSAAHIAGEDVPALIARLKTEARPYAHVQAETLLQAAEEAEKVAGDLLRAPSILAEYGRLVERMGLKGEDRNARLLYLALVTRFLPRPVSVAVKGPSSGGKSYTVETVLRTVPESTYYALSSMSERALAYSEEPLQHRFLVLYEAAGMAGDFATYLLRTLLSEARIRYETVEKTGEGLRPKLIERPGPTGLLVTTTWASMHAENETRMLSLTVRDDRDQTARVLQALADRVNGSEPAEIDLTPWHALQTWLELAGGHDVTIPYAHALGALSDPRAVRMRRDFYAVLALVQAHAILHQQSRARDPRGRIIATMDDYAAVYDLVIATVSEGVKASVSQTVRDTVAAVAEIEKKTSKPVTVSQLAERLCIDSSAARRRVAVAIEDEYLVDLAAEKDQEGRKKHRGKAMRLTVGDPMPAEASVLPTPAELAEKITSGIPPNTTAQLHNFGDDLAAEPPEEEVFEL